MGGAGSEGTGEEIGLDCPGQMNECIKKEARGEILYDRQTQPKKESKNHLEE